MGLGELLGIWNLRYEKKYGVVSLGIIHCLETAFCGGGIK